jgi:hypothetical protein
MPPHRWLSLPPLRGGEAVVPYTSGCLAASSQRGDSGPKWGAWRGLERGLAHRAAGSAASRWRCDPTSTCPPAAHPAGLTSVRHGPCSGEPDAGRGPAARRICTARPSRKRRGGTRPRPGPRRRRPMLGRRAPLRPGCGEQDGRRDAERQPICRSRPTSGRPEPALRPFSGRGPRRPEGPSGSSRQSSDRSGGPAPHGLARR